MVIVKEKCKIQGTWYDEYIIKRVEWDLDTLTVGVLCLYYKQNLYHKIAPSFAMTHWLGASEEVDVHQLIEQIKELHRTFK